MTSPRRFTFAELPIVVAAVPGLNSRVEEAGVARPSAYIVQIEEQLEHYRVQHHALPDSLEVLSMQAAFPPGAWV